MDPRPIVRFALRGRAALATIFLALAASTLAAQELSPRAYWPAPTGTKVVTVGYAHSRGDVLTDRSLPVYGVDSRIDNGVVGYLQTFRLFGRTANFVVEVPYARATTEGALYGVPVRRDYSGLGDIATTLAINLVGAPAMTPEEFARLRSDPPALLGASLRVVAPTGHYEAQRLLNVGTNRWAAKLELGSALPLAAKWLAEFQLAVWLFGDNDEFVSGKREQDPVYSVQGHLVRRFRAGFWASLDANYFTGGRTTIGGVERDDLQQNSRLGGTIVYPVARGHVVKLGYSTGLRTESGGDFDQYTLSYSQIFR